MPSRDRDSRAVAEIECPRCHALPGHPCFTGGKPGPSGPRGPYCHQERRVANQSRRRAIGTAGPIETPAGTPVDRYIWHETIQTQHTRRSFLSEVAPDILETVRGWLGSDRMELPGGYICVVMYRSADCIEAEVLTPGGIRLVRFGVASASRCGQSLWQRLRGEKDAKPAEPWCAAWLDPAGVLVDQSAYLWLGDFERCFAWAWLTRNLFGING